MHVNIHDMSARIAALAGVAGRRQAAGALACALGAHDLVLLVLDRDIDALVLAPGMEHGTLPGGPQWRALLAGCRSPGVLRMSVPWNGATSPAVACCTGEAAAILLGGEVSEHEATLLAGALPMLGAALTAQQELAVARGELAATRNELNQSAAFMQALDDARRDVDRALRKLDAQARALEVARHRAEEAARAKDAFLAMLGHELRNPLAPMSTALEVLRRRGEWSREHDIMHRQMAHMMRLVDDLLDVARIAGGKLMLDPRCVALDTVVDRALESVQPLIEQGEHPLHVDVPAGLFVAGDRQRLVQVLSNLLANAAKYSNPGAPISVVACRRSEGIEIAVADRGIGIDPGKLETIFDLFEQQEHGIDRAQGGLGLGLAIVRDLVQLHGGSVRAGNRADGPGSRFTVLLPAAMDGLATPPEPPPHRAGPSGAGRVLVVDDNVDAALTLTLALEMAGYEVRTAHDGPRALDAAANFLPAVAVLDIGLPGMDGYELAGALRKLATPPRLVALTGYGQSGDVARAEQAGFDSHFVKPVDLDALCDQLQRLVPVHQSRG